MSNKIKILSRYTLAALALIPLYAGAKMADTPFVLDNQEVTSGGSGVVKPNVMLLIDNSYSMRNPPNGQSTTPKIVTTKNILKQILSQYTDSINWSLQTLNPEANVDLNGYTTDHRDMIRRVEALKKGGNGFTPTTSRFYKASEFIRNATRYRCQKNYILLLSDGDSNFSCITAPGLPDKFPTPPAPEKALGTINDSYFGSKSPGQCLGNTEGYPYDSVWDRNDGLRFFSQTLATKDFKTSGLDAAGKSWNGDAADPQENGVSKFAKQTAQTFTIGFGNGLSKIGKTYLERGASQPSYYFSTENESELSAKIKEIFDEIHSSSMNTTGASYGSTAPAVTRSNTAPGAAAVVFLDTNSWSSQLRFFKLNPDGSVNIAAGYSQPSFNNRKTLINTGSGTFFSNELKDLDNTYFNTVSATATDQNEWREALIPWTTRQGVDSTISNLASSRKYSQAYRERSQETRDLGDIIDSPVLAIGDRNRGNREEFLVTSANDGMVHLFRSNANADATNPYDLLVSYMPAAMERTDDQGNPSTLAKTLKDIAHPSYGHDNEHPHRYMINGGFTLLRTPTNEDSQIFMFGAMGQGGRGAYALNIGGKNRSTGKNIALSTDNSSAWKTDIPLFETAKGNDNTLGYTIGTPKIGRISIQRELDQPIDITQNIRYAGFLSSGFPKSKPTAASSQETALYVYDMLGQEAGTDNKTLNDSKPGKLLGKITAPGGSGGLATPTLLDTNYDGIYDLAYAGDYTGNMFRFDLRHTPDKWSAVKIFSAKGGQPITSAPTISRRPNGVYVVIFGTGSEIYTEDLNNTETQALYGIYDDINTTGSAATVNELLKQSMIERDGYYYLSDNSFDSSIHKGWTIDLTAAPGEHVTVQPSMLLRTALFTTRMYAVTESLQNNDGSDPCIASTYKKTIAAKSRSLAINSTNGGALTANDARLLFDATATYIDPANQTTYYPNGKIFDNLLSQVLVRSNNQSSANNNPDDPRTLDGEGGGSGTDTPLSTNPIPAPRNTCFDGSNQPYLQTGHSGDTNSPVANIAITGPACISYIRRVNWREIF